MPHMHRIRKDRQHRTGAPKRAVTLPNESRRLLGYVDDHCIGQRYVREPRIDITPPWVVDIIDNDPGQVPCRYMGRVRPGHASTEVGQRGLLEEPARRSGPILTRGQ